MLAAMKEAGEFGPGKPNMLLGLGVSVIQSSRWQTEAKLDEDQPPVLVPITPPMRWGGG